MVTQEMSVASFSNSETTSVYLWMVKAEPSHRFWLQRVRQTPQEVVDAEGHPTVSPTELEALAEEMRNEFEDGVPIASFYSVYSDLLNRAMERVR